MEERKSTPRSHGLSLDEESDGSPRRRSPSPRRNSDEEEEFTPRSPQDRSPREHSPEEDLEDYKVNREEGKAPADEEDKEEEKKDIEQVEEEPLLQKDVVYRRERSYCLPHRERAILERSIMDLPQKSELLIAKDNETVGASKGFLRKLENDGIYKIGAIAEDMVTKTLTKPIDLSLRQVHRNKVKSAILCNRINALKKKHFKLELMLGKISLRDHSLFIDEDKCAFQLKELHEEFERLAGLGMIPFYENRLKSLTDELYRAEDARKKDDDHIRFLKATIKDIRSKRNQEKKMVKKLGIDLYEKWLELKQIRKDQDFQSTTIELKAREFDLPRGKKEIVFYLNQTEIPTKSLTGKTIPSKELNRRNKVKKLGATIEVYVNDKLVDISKPANVSWPNFEADFGDQFILFLYTMPKSIELRLKIHKTEVSRIPIEVPGTKVEALTSSYALVREVKFSRNESKAQKQKEKDKRKGTYIKEEERQLKSEDKKMQRLEKQEEKQKVKEEKEKAKKDKNKNKPNQQNANQPPVSQPANPNQPQAVPGAVAAPNAPLEDKLKRAEESKTAKEIEKEKWEAMIKGPDIRGFIYFKAEWKGEGSDMPPAIRLLLEREHKDETHESTKMVKHRVIDINDPRYDYIIKRKKEENEHLKKLIEMDSLNPLHDLQPFRHIQLINQDTHFELVNLDIPISEQEVVNDPGLSYLIEKFSKMGALQTYDQMLREVKSFSGSDRLQDMSSEVLERRQQFLEKIKRVQKDIKTGSNKPNINYSSIVREVGGIKAQNPFAGLVESIFAPRRKLRPRVVNKATVGISQCTEAQIQVQIVSGINIPIRKESIQAIEALKRQINGPQQQQVQRPGAAAFNANTPGNYPGEPYPGDQFGGGQQDYPPRDPYNNRPLTGPGGFRGGDSFSNAPPNRRGATMDYNRGFGGTGGQFNQSGYPPSGMMDSRMGASGAIAGAMADRNAPPYSGYGAVQNPYGNTGYGGNQFAPPDALRKQRQEQMGGAFNKAKMELTGPNKLIQGAVFIEVRYSSNRPGNEVPQIRRTRE